jgi:hypothetical protein
MVSQGSHPPSRCTTTICDVSFRFAPDPHLTEKGKLERPRFQWRADAIGSAPRQLGGPGAALGFWFKRTDGPGDHLMGSGNAGPTHSMTQLQPFWYQNDSTEQPRSRTSLISALRQARAQCDRLAREAEARAAAVWAALSRLSQLMEPLYTKGPGKNHCSSPDTPLLHSEFLPRASVWRTRSTVECGAVWEPSPNTLSEGQNPHSPREAA